MTQHPLSALGEDSLRATYAAAAHLASIYADAVGGAGRLPPEHDL
jgi:hypothetical protein